MPQLTDDLDLIDFEHLDAPTFVTNVAGTLVLTPFSSFPAEIEAWNNGNAITCRELFLAIGNCHLAEVQVQRLHPKARKHVLDHLPERLPVGDPVQYTRTLNTAIKAAPPPERKSGDPPQPPPQRKATPEELDTYRRCLLVRAMAYGGSLEGVSVVAFSMGVIDYRSPAEPTPP